MNEPLASSLKEAWEFGFGCALSSTWKWGRDPYDFHGGKTIWIGPVRFWYFTAGSGSNHD